VARKFALTRWKTRLKCAKAVTSGKTEGPCPDAKGAVALDKAQVKFRDAVLKGCDDTAVVYLDLGFPCDLYVESTFNRVGMGTGNSITRLNRFERCLAAATAGSGDLGAETGTPLPDQAPFSFGVNAGDATDVAFVAWTRSTDGANAVTLEVATDAAFTAIVGVPQALGLPVAVADNTVRGEVTGLSPSTQYYYRFTQNGATSRVGRIKTAPAAGSTAPFTFAFTGDANAFFKPFSVLELITQANPDVWLFIGDTIYGDDSRSGSGVATVRSDYHAKYRENLDDHAMRDLTASIGMYTIWDDHEVTNDFWGTDPAVQTQMIEGNQAFRDYMPIREDGGDAMRLYRSFRWGDVAEFFLIDARQYRSAQADVIESDCVPGTCSVTNDDCVQQPDCDAFQLGQLCHKGTCSVTDDLCSTQADCDAIQLGQTCDQNQGMTFPNANCQAEIDNPARTYLGATQLAWLKNGLQTSPAKFKFVMNGPLVSELLFVPYDRWEGYSTERQDLLDFITGNTIKNVVFLSTDIHAAIVNGNVNDSGVKELVAGAVGMDPIRRELPASVAALVGSLPLLFPTVTYYDIDRFNVATATVSQTEFVMSWRDGSGQLLKQLTVPAQ
jgi:phosphodiesterase/alkaline phosphatase D-like protein